MAPGECVLPDVEFGENLFCLCQKSEIKGRNEVVDEGLLLMSLVGDKRQDRGDEG